MILNIYANLNSDYTSTSWPITPKITIQQTTMNIDPKTVSKDLKEIQSRPSQVCNCGEIGFNPNVSWIIVVCTYKFFTGKLIWDSQTVERSPLWCTDMIFTKSDCQCFMPPMIVHKAQNYTQDIHWNLSNYWLVHNTPSGYMDRDGWMKAMSFFIRTCGDIKINP